MIAPTPSFSSARIASFVTGTVWILFEPHWRAFEIRIVSNRMAQLNDRGAGVLGAAEERISNAVTAPARVRRLDIRRIGKKSEG